MHIQHVRPNRGPHKKGAPPHKRSGDFLHAGNTEIMVDSSELTRMMSKIRSSVFQDS